MTRPRGLDLFCCAGGSGMGYHRAGFDMTGVDIAPQPRYPFAFIQTDALEYLAEHGHEYDFVDASPPCQHWSPLNALSPDKVYPALIEPTRALLEQLWNDRGIPYIIENVMSAPLVKERSVTLCGGMFGLRTYRHRRFESRLALTAPAHPKHVIRTATKQRRKLWDEGWHVSITGDVGTYVGPAAMGIDWMSGNELCEAVPPVYAEHLGSQVIEYLQANAA